MFQIDPMSRTPIYEQLVAQTERLIMAGVLRENEQLPSVRTLSFTLSVNPNTIQKAYNDLCARQIVCAVPGRGCFVSPQARERLQSAAYQRLPVFRALVRELMLAGLSREELLSVLDDCDRERSNQHDSGTESDQTV